MTAQNNIHTPTSLAQTSKSAYNPHIRNIAIIAHVDHGKTTLVDKLLKDAGTFLAHQHVAERVMDSNDLEKERGITIFAKNASLTYKDIKINIVDTPGHADFGGEVERVLGMVDGVLLLVDAVEGPMPQTRFVTSKALKLGLCPIVVINKIDRDGARINWVMDATFELFDKLGATDQQLDFPVVYASALNGIATTDLASNKSDMIDLFDTIINHVPPPKADSSAPLLMQIAALDYSSFVGRIGIGRIIQGSIQANQNVMVVNGDTGAKKNAKIKEVQIFSGLNKSSVNEAQAGDIVLINGVGELSIGETICDSSNADCALPMLNIDEPTLSMNFQVNTSPLAGTEGKFVTSRQIKDRLQKELLTNVALRVEDTANTDIFLVSGRGELHLSILIENMRREGYELAVAKPHVVYKIIDGVKHEPYENLTVDIEQEHQGPVMEELGRRRGDLKDMVSDSKGRVRLEYRIPTRGLIGFQNEFLTLTRGSGLIAHIFDSYDIVKGEIEGRRNGVLVSQENGLAVAYALWYLEERGRLFVHPGEKLYEGMIIGIHAKDNDLVVNPIKEKKLTNVRASGKDDAILLTPPIKLSLEQAIEFIEDDELVEITPQSIRIRKRYLSENERKRMSRSN